ncbi:MAG: 3-hydroxyacyl-CoA dehydrogenase NAD-binding domain-containing protein [Candidatus Bathyarchaeota archaeon]|nr:3-hydroxyacyl-CoA dehydrogenase NAD-binding domain-containing protein [Candidatus Bathyarchaeota archaeon]
MPPLLQLNPQDVDSLDKRRKFNVAVVGCGHKGIFFANAFADAGFSVVCTDADASVVKKVAKGKTAFCDASAEAKLKSHIAAEKIDVTSDLKKTVAQSDVVVIAISTRVDEQKKTDDNGLINTCKQVGAALQQGALVVYGGVAALGFVDGTVRELLENTSGLKVGQDFGLAYCPILTTNVSLANSGVRVAADDKASLAAASTILKTLTNRVQEVNDLKTAQVATLFTIAKQDATNALTNELAMFCETANIDYYNVLDVLNLNDPSFQPSIAEGENHEAAYLLLESAENLNAKLRLAALARQINEDMVKHAVNLTQEALRNAGKSLRRGRVAVLGSANPAAATCMFAKLIEQKGAKVAVYDPAAKKEAKEAGLIKTSLNEAVEGADCIVTLTGQEQISHLNLKKLKALMKSPPVVVDLVGKFDPSQVETEGFIYTGLGRGTGKK